MVIKGIQRFEDFSPCCIYGSLEISKFKVEEWKSIYHFPHFASGFCPSNFLWEAISPSFRMLSSVLSAHFVAFLIIFHLPMRCFIDACMLLGPFSRLESNRPLFRWHPWMICKLIPNWKIIKSILLFKDLSPCCIYSRLEVLTIKVAGYELKWIIFP